jgi:Zinc dependent phospholipase C
MLCVFSLLIPSQTNAYSVLTHQAIIDLAWDDSILPLLRSKYPNATEKQLRLAHAYAYGGCAIQDMGYYPFGKTFFSDLTHYVRTGDFVASLFRNARDLNELAFAAGALSHYVGDSYGHAIAVNHATALAFPKLERRYGHVVTYEDDPHAHVRTEFGFDIEQVSKHRFPPRDYLERLGLRVPRRLMEKAFFETYGLPLHSILGNERAAIRSYRSAVRSFIPFFGRGEVVLHRHQFLPDLPTPEYEIYSAEMAKADFKKHTADPYQHPGFLAHVTAVLIFIVPKIGAASMLSIKIPNHETQELYVRSMNETLARYREHLAVVMREPIESFALTDRDLDTGAKVKPGGYIRTDQTYAKLVHAVVSNPSMEIPLGLREDVLSYYADPTAPIATKSDKKAWERLQNELEKFKQMKAGSRLTIPREE